MSYRNGRIVFFKIFWYFRTRFLRFTVVYGQNGTVLSFRFQFRNTNHVLNAVGTYKVMSLGEIR